MGRPQGSKNGIQPNGAASVRPAPEEHTTLGADQFNNRNKIAEGAEALMRLNGGK